MSKHKKPPRIVQWTPFERCSTWSDADGNAVPIPPDVIVMRNNIYTVTMYEVHAGVHWPDATWLSIKRNDRHVIHDWRELQRIKNELCDPEREAIEIYPRESRLVDTSNQFHLFVFPEGFTIPFGYAERMIIDETPDLTSAMRNARQRPWPAGQKPIDAMAGERAALLYAMAPNLGTRTLHRRKAALEPAATEPWDDCKVAFRIDSEDPFNNARTLLPWFDGVGLPVGWRFDETDGSGNRWCLDADGAGARLAAVFRVAGGPRPEDGERVKAWLRQIGALK
jgi:hypothetical protein